jgi:hypothetical protein
MQLQKHYELHTNRAEACSPHSKSAGYLTTHRRQSILSDFYTNMSIIFSVFFIYCGSHVVGVGGILRSVERLSLSTCPMI